MTADLAAVLRAAHTGELLLSTHYLEERLGGADRPWPHEIVFGLLRDAPRIIRDDDGMTDPRGAICEVECEAPDGSLLVVRINYEKIPMKIVTGFRR